MSYIYSPSFLRGSQVWLSSAALACGLFTTLLSTLFAQDASNPEWLPKTLADSYAEALSAATDYVLTREGCARLIEAKLSESSNLGDPKFILTCADSSGVTANFVIWQRDIDNNFSDNRYREKSQDKNLTLILSPVEAQRKLQLENSGLIDQCKDQLQTLLESREIVMAESDIHLSQRGEQPVSVNFNYQVGAGDLRQNLVLFVAETALMTLIYKPFLGNN